MGGLICGAEGVFLPEDKIKMEDVEKAVKDVCKRFGVVDDECGGGNGATARSHSAAAAAAKRLPDLSKDVGLSSDDEGSGDGGAAEQLDGDDGDSEFGCAVGERLWRKTSIYIRNERASNHLFTSEFLKALFESRSENLFDVRTSKLGHLQQGGAPSITDRFRYANVNFCLS